MSSPAPFKSVAELLKRSLSIRHVFGEPVQRGDITVIPVARVAYGFGAGGGRGPGRPPKKSSALHSPGLGKSDDAGSEAETGVDARSGTAATADADAEGEGGGGGVWMEPVGALEIGPEGVRFIRFRPLAPLLGAAVIGLALGWLVARRR